MIIPEIELGQVAVQVLLRAMLIDALHAALEDAEVALDRIGMNGTINVLADAVSDPTVT